MMKIDFDEKELSAIKDLKLPFDVTTDLNDDEYFLLDEKVAEAIMDHLDKNYDPTPKGKIYESIMDKISQY